MNYKLLTLVVVGAMTFTACSADSNESSDKGNQNTEITTEASTKDEGEKEVTDVNEAPLKNKEEDSEINSRYAYDQDWANIKEAILKKDYKGLKDYCVDDDVELLIDQIHYESEFVKQLKAMSYEDLETGRGPTGDVTLVAPLAVSGEYEGQEFESGIYIYLEQGDPNLMIVSYLAAG
ncbi:MAG: hypothetical protein NXI10_01845 [bacterium]|nr:hypothetical protein [bacterium]